MARETDIQGFITQVITIPAGGTNAVLVSPIPGQVAQTIKYQSGGSLEIIPAPYSAGSPIPWGEGSSPIAYTGYTVFGGGYSIGLGGSGVAGASLAVANGTGYMLGTAEIFSSGGAARYYLVATSTQTIAYLNRGMGPGF